MKFELDDQYLTDVIVKQVYYTHGGKETLTNEELVDVIKNPILATSTSHVDHPEFAKLRNLLEEQGYIKTERNWWNGDRVLKSFTLNGIQFNVSEQFPCGCAMRSHLKFKVI